MYQILLVEDDPDIATISQTYLQHAGYGTSLAGSVQQAKQLIDEQEFDLMLLDMMLPDGDGQQLCSYIRSKSNCPVIFITCIDEENTMVSAFECGADDYVVKPVHYDALLARIKAHLRREEGLRARGPETTSILKFKKFALDTVRRQLIVAGEVMELSTIEYALLYFMVKNPNALLLYDELYNHVWVNDSLGDTRTVMVHISNLRKKVDPGKRGIIQTVRGAGYVFNDV